MTTMETKRELFIKKYWPAIAFIFALGGIWATLKNSVDANAQAILAVQQHQVTIDTQQASISAQLSQIQTDLQWIKATLSRK